MRSATIHAVFTPEASICRGGHFYAMLNMSDAIYGLMHTFVGSTVLTNTEHTEASHLPLRQMVSHIYSRTVAEKFEPSSEHLALESVHIPKFDTAEGVKDFFNLLNVTELSDVLNPFSYRMPGVSLKERLRMVHARRLSRILLQWFQCHYHICVFDGEEHIIEDQVQFYYSALGCQTKALLQYKVHAKKRGMKSHEKLCTAQAMEKIINQVFERNKTFLDAFREPASTSLDCLGSYFRVEVRQPLAAFNLDNYSMQYHLLLWQRAWLELIMKCRRHWRQDTLWCRPVQIDWQDVHEIQAHVRWWPWQRWQWGGQWLLGQWWPWQWWQWWQLPRGRQTYVLHILFIILSIIPSFTCDCSTRKEAEDN